MLKRFQQLHQRGDTIVEVMVVLAVLGSAIGISYSTANRSLLNARQAQESSRATTIAQSQVEQLRAMADNPDVAPHDTYIYTTDNLPFCMIENNAQHIKKITDITNYPVECRYDQASGFEYDVSIKHSTLGDDKFTVQVEYDDILGQGRDSVTLIYRVHSKTP
jgi:prepilin-type N-terminal cleavage/methylation domain-containing protein